MRIRRWIVGSVTSLAVLVGAALLVTETPWFRNWARGFVVKEVTTYIDADVHIGAFEGSVFSKIRLRDVTVTRHGQDLLRASVIEIAYRPYALLSHTVLVNQLSIDGLRAAAVEERGGWNLASLVKPQPASTEPSRPWPVLIQHVSITDAAARVAPATGAPLFVTLTASGWAMLTADGVHTQIDSLRAAESTNGVTIDRAKVAVTNSDSALDLVMSLAAHGATIDGSAHLDTASKRIDGFAAVRTVDLSKLPHAAGAPSLSSSIGADVDVRATTGAAVDWALNARMLSSQVASARLAAGSTAFVESNNGSLRYRATGRITALNAAEFASLLPRSAQLSTNIAGRFSAYGAGLDARDRTLNAEVTLDDSRVTSALIARGTAGKIRMTPVITTYSAHGQLARLNLRDFAALTGTPRDFDSNIAGAFSVSGQGTDEKSVRASGNVRLSQSRLADTSVDHLTAHVSVDRRHVVADIDTAFTGLNGRTLQNASPVALSLNGTVTASVDVTDYSAKNVVDTLSGRVHAVITDSSIKNVAVRHADIDATADRGLASVRAFNVEADGINANASGNVALGERGSSSLKYVIDVTDASKFSSLVGAEISGAGRAEGTFEGTRANARTSGELKTFSAAYGTTASALALTSTYDVSLPDFDPAQLDASAVASASFVKVSTTDIDRLSAKLRYREGLIDIDGDIAQQGRSISVDGSLSTDASGSKILLRRLGLATEGLNWTLAPGTAATITMTPDTFSVDHLELQNGAQRLTAEGGLSRVAGKTAPAPLEVHGANVDISDLAALSLSTRPVDGVLGFDAHIVGSIDAPSGTVKLTADNIKSGDAAFEQLTGTVALDAPRVSLDMFLRQSAQASLSAKGTLPSSLAFGEDAGVPLDVRVTSDGVDLGLVQSFTNELSKVTGSATVDVRVTGAAKDPAITGTAAIAEGAFTAVSTGVTYRHLNAQVTLADNRAKIDAFSIQDSDGHTMRVTGATDLLAGASGRSFDVALTSDEIHILDNELGNISVTADLKAGATAGGTQMNGSLKIAKGRLELDELLPRFTSNPYSTERKKTEDEARAAAAQSAAQAAAGPSMWDSAKIAISLELPDNLVVRGRDLRPAATGTSLGDINVTLGGSVQIAKATGSDPAVTGSLQAVRGFYQFQGRRFDVERGSTVRFDGTRPMDAVLAISATRDVSGVIAKVQVKGTVDRPQIVLSSTPTLDEGDILSLIVFNQPINELGTSEKVTLGQRAGALATGAIASPIADSVARALNLDMVEITAPESNGQGSAVTLGQQLSDRIYLNFKQQFGRGDISQLSFEYRFNEAMRIITSVAESSQSSRRSQTGKLTGIDFVYFIRY